MADIVCVEPGVSEAHCVVEVNGNDTLVFPHVDSCMSVTLFVPSSTLIGGHAGMMDTATFEMNASGLLDAMIQRMLRLVGTRKIVRAVFAGNANPNAGGGEDWQVVTQIAKLRRLVGNPHLPCPLINSWETPKGVDVFFDNAELRMKVQLYEFDRNRGELGAPTRRAPALNVPYHAIRNAEVK
jgi:hypothetical protein